MKLPRGLASLILLLSGCVASAQPTWPTAGTTPSTNPTTPTYFEAHGQQCSACNAAGKVTCSTCKGDDWTKQTCPTCKGQDWTKQTCQTCNGIDWTKQTCPTCKGVDWTRLACTTCQGTGKLRGNDYCSCWVSGKRSACYSCWGTGKRSACYSCWGSAKRSACYSCWGSGKRSACYSCWGRASDNVTCSSCNGSGYVERLVKAPTPSTHPTAENGSYYGEISDLTARPKTVFVSGYYRKDGTYVRSHYRSPPGDGPSVRGPPILYPDTPLVAENGSYYGQPSQATGNPKTVHVKGYYRKDGTYVRGHYRSSPRR